MELQGLLLMVWAAALVLVALWFGGRAVYRAVRKLRADPPPASRLVPAAVLGLAGAILATSVIVFAMRALLLWIVAFSFGAALVLPFVTAWWLMQRLLRARWLPEPRWPAWLVAAPLLWSAAALAPWVPRYAWLRTVSAREIPIYPGSQPAVSVRFVDGENYGDLVEAEFAPAADSGAILRFYERELERRGWELDTTYVRQTKEGATRLQYWRGFRTMRVHVTPPEPAGLVSWNVRYEP